MASINKRGQLPLGEQRIETVKLFARVAVSDAEALAAVAKRQGLTVSEAVRRAVAEYIRHHRTR